MGVFMGAVFVSDLSALGSSNRGSTAARGWGGVIRTSLLVVMKRKKPWPSLDSEAFEVSAKDPKQLPECQALDTGDDSWYSPSTK